MNLHALLGDLVAARSPRLYGWLWRYCYRCDQIRSRRHQHRNPPDALVRALRPTGRQK